MLDSRSLNFSCLIKFAPHRTPEILWRVVYHTPRFYFLSRRLRPENPLGGNPPLMNEKMLCFMLIFMVKQTNKFFIQTYLSETIKH